MKEKNLDGNIVEVKMTLLKEEGKDSYLFIIKEGSIPFKVFHEDKETIYFYNNEYSTESPGNKYYGGLIRKTGYLASTNLLLEEEEGFIINSDVETEDVYIGAKCDLN